MTNNDGFWSYVHADDDAQHGRITALGRAVKSEYELLTAEPLSMFLDRDELEWGDDWENKVDDSLAGGAFFVPVLTPRYFKSEQCRRELSLFARQAEALGLSSLILPILYVNVPELHDPESTDPLIVMLKRFQWQDWRKLRLTEPTSSEYLTAVAAMAERLVAAREEAQSADIADAAQRIEDASDDSDDTPGLLDRMARLEEVAPELEETLDAIAGQLVEVGVVTQAATTQIEAQRAQGKGIAARLTVARQLSQQLTGPAREVLRLGNNFTEQLSDVDSGIRAIVERAPIELAEGSATVEDVCSFFASIRSLSETSRESLGKFDGMIASMAPVERMSKDLRPPLRTFRQGLTVLAEGMTVTDSWVRLVDESGVDCLQGR